MLRELLSAMAAPAKLVSQRWVGLHRTRLSQRFYTILLFAFCPLLMAGQTYTGTSTITVGQGSLTYKWTTYTYQCEVRPGLLHTYKVTRFDTFSYSQGGTTTSLSGTADDQWGLVGTGGTCLADYVDPVTLTGPTFVIVFTPSGQTGSATIQYPATGYIDPKYIVVGVTYAPPGPSSTVSYTSSLYLGKTSGLSSSFSNMNSVTVSVSTGTGIKGWSSGKIQTTSSSSFTQSSTTSSSVTIGQTSSISNLTHGTGNAYQPVNHDYDVIWLWLNPVVVFTIDPNTPQNTIWNGYGYDMADQPAMDIYPISVGYLNGHFGALPASIANVLARSWAASQTFATGDGPGLTSADFTNILKADPFSSSTYTVALASGVSPATTTDGRFTISGGTTGTAQSYAYVQANPGSQPGSQTYQNTYTNQTTIGKQSTTTRSTSFGVDVSFKASFFITSLQYDLKYQNQLTWTDTSSSSVTSTTTKIDTLTITGPPCQTNSAPCVPAYTGPGEFDVYQDNIYGTFMFNPVN